VRIERDLILARMAREVQRDGKRLETARGSRA